MSVTLLNAVSVDTTGDWFTWSGGSCRIYVQATSFGGGTVTLESSVDGGTTAISENFDDGTTFSVVSDGVFNAGSFGQGVKIRAKLAGSSGADSVSVICAQV